MKSTKRIAILISGSGSNMRALVEDMLNDNDYADPVIIISDRAEAKGLLYAKKMNIETRIIDFKKISDKNKFEKNLITVIYNFNIDIICLAGFMTILSNSFLTQFEHSILNIHPSILPLFKGLNTHKKALNSGMAVHGATVHKVTEKLDSGQILGQAVVPIFKQDTEKSLASRVLKLEHRLYPLVLRRFINGDTDPILLI